MNEGQEKKQRRQRSDAGIPKLTERDLWLLKWIGYQYAIRRDQLEELLARQVVRQDLATKERTLTSAGIVRRWQSQNLVISRKIIGDQPNWIWLTGVGLSQMELPFTYVEPKPGKLNHIYWNNYVRMHVEKVQPTRRWISERALKWGREGRKQWNLHPVDAEVWSGEDLSKRIAIEVEVTAKSEERTVEIMQNLVRYEYMKIWYFVNRETKGVVRRSKSKLSKTGQDLILLFDIDKQFEVIRE